MTSTFTILCPEGIVLGADSRITRVEPTSSQILGYKDNIRKVYRFRKCEVGISHWGLAEFGNDRISILDFLSMFEKNYIVRGDTIIEVSEKLRERLEAEIPGIITAMGFHVSGFHENKDGEQVPQLRHVFHERCHRMGQFINENCHTEQHNNCIKMEYPNYFHYPILFNGDNIIANCLTNYIWNVRGERIPTERMNISECIDLTKFVLSTSIKRINFYYNRRGRVPPTVGGKTRILKIERTEGANWVR